MTRQEQTQAEARDYIRRIRAELVRLEDVMAHAEGFRGGAYADSLARCWQTAEGAVIEALQTAIRRQAG